MSTDFKNSVLVKKKPKQNKPKMKKLKEVLLTERKEGTQRLVMSLWEVIFLQLVNDKYPVVSMSRLQDFEKNSQYLLHIA